MGSVAAAAEDFTGVNLSGDSSSDQALRGQQEAARSSNAITKYMYDQNRADNQPWRDAGVKALTGLDNADFQRDFTQADFQADPGYNFRMQEGMKALERSAAARGGLMGGAFAKAATNYGQNAASAEYNNAYNRFNADRDRRFGRLSSLAGIGQTAQSQNAQMGTDYASTVSNNNMGAANAGAAQAMGQAQQRNDAIKSGTAAYMAFCDERLKTDITTPSKEDLAELRATLKPYAYRYKNEAHGVGPWIGVMAQDLAKTKLGASIVIPNEAGHLQIDMNKAFSLCLAAIAEG